MNLGNHYSVKQFRLKIAGAFLVFLCCLGLMFGDISTVSAGLFSDGLAEIRDVGQTVALAIKKAVSSPASIIDSIKCFFGFDCPREPAESYVATDGAADNITKVTTIQEGPKPSQNGEADEPAENNAALAVDPGAMPPVTGIYRNSITLNPDLIPALTPNLTPKLDALAGAGHLFEMTFEAPIQPPAENIVTYVNTITNTVIVDEETKNKVNLILRQLDSDRPSYSLGSTYHLPDDIRVKTIDVNSGKFTVDKHGNISTVGDFEITGNFTVTGAQTFSGAAALNAATAIPLFSIEQGGTGAALEADNITLKGSTIATSDSDTSLLINPNGTGAVQFHSASNFIDSTGSLVLDGDVTLTSGGTFYTTGNGNLVFAPNGTGNLVVGETGNTAKIVPFEDSTAGYDLGALTARWFDIYAEGKLDIDSTTLTASQLSFIDTGKITTGTSKDLTLQAGAAGKTRVTDGTDYVDIADGTQALYAVKGANAVKLANGTYAVDATGDVRLSGDITVNGGKIIFNGGNESIDNETAHLLKFVTSGDAQVVLGDEAGVNQFQIKDSNGNAVASIDSDGKATLANAAIAGSLGIGTADPQEALDVNGRVKLVQTFAPADTADKLYNVSGNLLWNGVNLTAAGGLPVGTEGQTLYNNAGVWTANSGLFYDDITGNVGIGTTSPSQALDVNGDLIISAPGGRIMGDFSSATLANRVVFQTSVTNGNTNFSFLPNGTATTSAINTYNSIDIANSAFGNFGISSSAVIIAANIRGTGSYLPMYFSTGGSERMRIDTTGNVGIGTTGPFHKLDVLQTGTTTGLAAIKGLNSGINVGTAYGVYGTATGASVTNVGGYFSATGGVTNNYGLIVESGNVGIGTTTPATALDVNGHATFRGAIFQDWYSDSAAMQTLEFRKGRGSFSSPAIVQNLDQIGQIRFMGYDGTQFIKGATIYSRVDGVPGTNDMPGRLEFSTTPDGAASVVERMRITNSGNVGIGTTSPSHKLDVLQTGTTTGLAAIKGLNSGINVGTAYGVYGTATGASVTNVGGYFSATGGVTNNYGLIVESGNVGIGTTGPMSALEVVDSSTNGIRGIVLAKYGDVQIGNKFIFLKGRGTEASPTILKNTDQIFNVTGYGYSGATFTEAASIIANVSEDWTATSNPTYFRMYSTLYGQTTPSERLRTDSYGNIGIGTAAPTSLLQIAQPTSGAGTVATNGTANLTGTGTQFLNTFKTGDTITVSGETVRTIATVSSNTSLTASEAFSTTASGLSYTLVGGNRFAILGNGNVGIGTTAPGRLLEVYGNGSDNPIKVAYQTGVYTEYGSQSIYTVRSTDTSINMNIGFNSGTGGGFSSTGGNIAFSTNNAGSYGERLRIATSGNVGIGTTVPSHKLDVLQTGTTTGLAAIKGLNSGINVGTAYGVYGTATGASVTNVGGYFSATGGVTNNYGLIVESGNVGIGTTAPSAKLSVLGSDSLATTTVANLSGSTGTGLVVMADGKVGIGTTAPTSNATLDIVGNLRLSGSFRRPNDSGMIATFGDSSVQFWNAVYNFRDTAGTSVLNISAGNVGIGTTLPSYKLDVQGGDINTSASYRILGAGIISAGGTALNVGVSTFWTTMNYGNASTTAHSFSSGNVGIGTTVPSHKLDVLQTGTTTGLAAIKGQNSGINVGTAYGVYGTATGASVTNVGGYFSATGGVTNNYGLIVESGNVGIGTTAPGSTLTVVGSMDFRTSNNSYSAVYLGAGTNSGAVRLYNGGNLVTQFSGSTEVSYLNNGGNVGIGTTAPASKLTVRSDSGAATVETLRLENLGTAAVATGGKMAFVFNKDGGVVANFAEIVGLTTSTDVTNYSGAMQFKLASNGTLDTLAEFGNPNIVFNRPIEVGVAGDTGISYDLQFMSTGTSHIASDGPLVIAAGDLNSAENLTLTTQSNEAASDFGTATAGAATTITDSTKAWTADEWIDGTITIIAGSGKGQTQTITDNDATSLTVADWDTVLGDPAANSVYRVAYAPGGDVLVDITNSNALFGGFKVLGNGNGGYAFRISPDGNVNIGGEGAAGSNLFVKQNITAYGSVLTLKQLAITEAGTPVATSAITGGSCADSTAYYYKVTAINDNGETTGTAQFTVTTGASGTNINLNTIAWTTVTGATGYKIYRSTENNDWDGDANDSWVDGKVVASPSITYEDNCAGDTASRTPPTANTTGGKLAINTASPTRRLEVLENTSAIPQMKIVSDSSNYAEAYVDAAGDMSLLFTGAGVADGDLIFPNANLKICSGGTFGSNSCPATGFSIAGTGNLIVENKVVADSFERICPAGYIWVPGNAKYGTMPGFCVMKYEAKSNSGAKSQADITPWVSVSQESARANCQALGLGYHLISEAEWLTIASNIADTPINDLNDGAAYPQLATGHSANTPTNALESIAGADPATSGCNLNLSLKNAANAYTSTCQARGDGAYGGDATDFGFYGTEQAWTGVYTSGADNDAQLRTHILSNGNVIWDLSGNVWEWVDALMNERDNPTDGTEVGDGVAEWEQWNTTYNLKGTLSNSRPPDDGWTSTNGIGQVYTWGQDETGTTLYAFRRGGGWSNGSNVGVFTLNLDGVPTGTGSDVGFRCAR